ncbi:MAG: hypothetical protein ACKE9I_03930 [Methylophagaceae bacterium]
MTACSYSASQDPITPIRSIDNIQELTEHFNKPFIGSPQPSNYSICHGHTCNKFAFISLRHTQWKTIEALFIPNAIEPQQEREQIKRAIALLEKLTGEQAGTDRDRAQNFTDQGLNGQLDCIDEATNSTVYLRLLFDSGLLKFHRQASRTSRGGLISPHNTATIIENSSNIRYAVDSWFGDNGQNPAIIPLNLWQSGWKPDIQ